MFNNKVTEMNKHMISLISLVLISVVLLYGCTTTSSEQNQQSQQLQAQQQEMTQTETAQQETAQSEPIQREARQSAWMDLELKDIRTGDTFKISDFSGKPVLIESFAVWCPVCLKQQKELKKLHDKLGDGVISISLDTDPNEDEQKVSGFLDENGFTWYYAVSPPDLTRGLIDEFGINFVNAPQAPVVLICEDGNSRFLPSGVKDVQDLQDNLAEGCAT